MALCLITVLVNILCSVNKYTLLDIIWHFKHKGQVGHVRCLLPSPGSTPRNQSLVLQFGGWGRGWNPHPVQMTLLGSNPPLPPKKKICRNYYRKRACQRGKDTNLLNKSSGRSRLGNCRKESQGHYRAVVQDKSKMRTNVKNALIICAP